MGNKTVSVVGLGKLGLCWALILADHGYDVLGVDVNTSLINSLSKCIDVSGEPGVPQLLQKHLNKGFKVSDSYGVIDGTCETIFIVVPTPSDNNDRFSTRYVRSVLVSLNSIVEDRTTSLDVVVVSTLMPGDTRLSVNQAFSVKALDNIRNGYVNILYNPEFIALGSVLKDMLSPDFILIGSDSSSASERLSSIYKDINGPDIPVCSMSIESAEVTKLSINTFLI